jgi:ribosome biogenesis GTPase
LTSTNFDNLIPYGWNDRLGTHLNELACGAEPGRVVASSRGAVLAQTATGELWCSIGGTVWQRLLTDGLTPCAGDWVALTRYEDESGARLDGLLPRATELLRHAAGRQSVSQALAANIDYVFLVMGLDANFNPARMERLVSVAWGSGAQPVAVLNKADLVPDPRPFVDRIEAVAPGVPVHAVSAEKSEGLAHLRSLLPQGSTGVLIGSSGVGKSTILNRLAGAELRATREVRRSDSRGRHTTSLRELFLVPGCGCLIDSPGVREIGLWGEASALDATFQDIADLAGSCRFADCAHQSEPGCAVKAALESGQLDPERYESYLKLKKELDFVASRVDARVRREREQRGKSIAKFARSLKKNRWGR